MDSTAPLQLRLARARDLFHDSNKLFVNARGLPIGSPVQVDLEDFGVHFEIDQTGLDDEAQRQQFHFAQHGALSSLVGAGWVDAGTEVDSSSRLLIAARRCGLPDFSCEDPRTRGQMISC